MRHRAIITLVGVGMFVFFFAISAQAHSTHDMDEWYADWKARLAGGLTIELIEEVSDMMDRHPYYLPPAFREADEVASDKPKPKPAPVDTTFRGKGSDWEQWRGLVAEYFPASAVDRAVCVIQHESGGNPDARNPVSGAAGLFQVMPFWFEHYGGSRYDPTNNTRVASLVLAEQGWSAWSVVNKGKC